MKRFWNYKVKSKAGNIVLLAVLPVLTLCCMEFYTHVPWDLSVPVFILNLAFYYLLYAVCAFLTGSTALGCVLGTLLPMLFGMVNYFVVDFRSSPIMPWDIYSLRTAVSVAGDFSYEIKTRLVLVVAGFLVILFLGSRTSFKIAGWRRRAAGLLLAVVCMFGYIKGIGTTQAVEAFGLDTTLFTPNVLYRNNGLMVGFLGILKYLKVEKPEHYSAETVVQLAQEYQSTEEAQIDLAQLPNIIVIMNEAFSDLSVFGDFETDSDYMPFIRSLEENTVKGNAYVSVKGGNTANSEYEFLTGDSMTFMPAGSVPYQQYIKNEMPGIASYLQKLGYQTNAIHPYLATGWSRNIVYPLLGFETMTFKNDFRNPETLRGYISDRAAFEKIIEQYEVKGEDERLFTFEVTMQNHSGYSRDVAGFEESVHLTALENKTTSVRAAEKYLTLISKSDQAFEELVTYFEGQDEDTIILMFGDHQPSDYITNTILKLLGLDRDTSDDVFYDNYIVPFVMWANFDIGEEQVEGISLNYLGGLLLEKAGVPQTAYQKYLNDLRKTLPAVTANMIMTADGERYRYDDGEALYGELLNQYQSVVYNHLADVANRVEDFFDSR